jgi:hypothetical protein
MLTNITDLRIKPDGSEKIGSDLSTKPDGTLKIQTLNYQRLERAASLAL